MDLQQWSGSSLQPIGLEGVDEATIQEAVSEALGEAEDTQPELQQDMQHTQVGRETARQPSDEQALGDAILRQAARHIEPEAGPMEEASRRTAKPPWQAASVGVLPEGQEYDLPREVPHMMEGETAAPSHTSTPPGEAQPAESSVHEHHSWFETVLEKAEHLLEPLLPHHIVEETEIIEDEDRWGGGYGGLLSEADVTGETAKAEAASEKGEAAESATATQPEAAEGSSGSSSATATSGGPQHHHPHTLGERVRDSLEHSKERWQNRITSLRDAVHNPDKMMQLRDPWTQEWAEKNKQETAKLLAESGKGDPEKLLSSDKKVQNEELIHVGMQAVRDRGHGKI